MYDYKMVQVTSDLATKMGKSAGAAATVMQGMVDAHTGDGWEYYRSDSLSITEKPGCIMGLLGQKEVITYVNVLCFRRAKSAGNA